MAYYGYGGYNPTQARIDQLQQQRNMIDMQLQQLSQPPAPNVNVNVQPQGTTNNGLPFAQQNFDFNGRYVSDANEAKQAAAHTLPLIFIDKEKPYIYMKDTSGVLKTFKLEEVQEMDQTSTLQNQVNDLNEKMNAILAALSTPPVQSQTQAEKTPSNTAKKTTQNVKKEG